MALITVLVLFFPRWVSAQTPAEELAELTRKAPPLRVSSLVTPIASVRQGLLLRAPNPDKATWDLLQIYFPEYGGPNTIVVIDLATHEVKTIHTDRGWNFHLCPAIVAPNGKLFISVLDSRLRQKICTYDASTNELVLDAVPLPEEILGETHPLVLGTDGRLYAIGQHPSKSATAAQIDPDTLAVTFYGPIGPSHAPNACWGYSGGADDRYIYIASGKIPWYLVAFDRQTRQWKVLLETATSGGYVGVEQRPDGCAASATGVVGTEGETRRYWLYQGHAIPVTDPRTSPWASRISNGLSSPWPPAPRVELAFAVPDSQGYAEIWVERSEPDKAPEGPPPGLSERDCWDIFRFQVPVYPHVIYRLREMADGRLFGTAGAYEGNFTYDPQSGQATHLGKIELSHYATAFWNGKIYMSGYPTSPLYEYDPNLPWTAGKVIDNRWIKDDHPKANPRRVLYLGSKMLAGTHKMYGAAVGADRRIYFGGRWMRDGQCGGLAWFDPRTGEAGGIWEPLSNYQVTHLAACGQYIVLSTCAVADSVLGKPTPAQGALWFFDTTTEKLNGMVEPIEGVRGTGPIVATADKVIVGWTENPGSPTTSILYAVDGATRQLVYRHVLPWRLPVAIGSNQQEPWDLRIGPDGWIWSFAESVLIRIEPRSGNIVPVGKVSPGGPIAFSGGSVYLGGTPDLRKIEDVVVQEVSQ